MDAKTEQKSSQNEKVISGTHLTTNLFIGNISLDTTEEKLFEAFSKYGPIGRLRVFDNNFTLHSVFSFFLLSFCCLFIYLFFSFTYLHIHIFDIDENKYFCLFI